MKMKRGLKYTLLVGVMVLVGGITMSATNSDFTMGRNLQILYNMFREVSLFYVDSVDSDELLKEAAKGMSGHLDPYTELIPESEMADFEIMTTGKYGGIGSIIRKSGDYAVIAQPYKGFPADKAGLVIGDVILAINGKSIKGMDVSTVSSSLKGAPGSSLKLTVRKLLTGTEEEVTLKRERIVISGVSYKGMISDSVGYIIHNDFTENCSGDIRNAIMELKKAGMTSLVLDLRSNGGGILQEAVKILSMFLPKGTPVVKMQGRQKSSNMDFVTTSEPIDTLMPVVVLVNNLSASASEIVAGAFQDLDRGVLLGQRTYGKGLVQSTRPLGYNAYLKITTAKYYIPSGRCIQAIDYAHRDEQGGAEKIPDSLIQQYTTSHGRKVYDGGGVMPDIVIASSFYSHFSVTLYSLGYIEEFANLYYKTHRDGVDPKEFHLSEADYSSFVKFMEDKTVDFDSETQQALQALRKVAQEEKYIDRIGPELTAIEEKIREDKATDLKEFRKDIAELLENEIVLRYHYKEGATLHNIPQDLVLQEALQLLADPQRYQTILFTQDTARP